MLHFFGSSILRKKVKIVYVVNDLHGSSRLIAGTIEAIDKLDLGDILVINGDGAGSRGPRMNDLVKTYYEVRRGETDEKVLMSSIEKIIGEKPEVEKAWIYNAVHAGMFRKLLAERYEKFAECLEQELTEVLEDTLNKLAKVAKVRQVKIYYLPGNGEVTPYDFFTADISTEVTVAPKERFYQKIAEAGYFRRFGIEFIPYVTKLEDDAILISTNLLDLDKSSAIELFEAQKLLATKFSRVIVHYPPSICPIGNAFSFWTPNSVDVKRANALFDLLDLLCLSDNAQIYFGHIHLGSNDARMMPYPSTMGFEVGKYHCIWVKPGVVLKI